MSISLTSSSGGTLDQYISQILALERQPAVRLESRKTLVSQKLAVLTDISSKLTALKTSLAGLKATGSLSSLHAFTVSSSDEDVFTATASADATAGTHLLRVSQLARSHALASGGFVKSGTSLAAGSYAFNITVNGTTTGVSVTLASGDNNETALAKVATAINLSGAKVAASVVTSDPVTATQKIVIAATDGGTSNIISSIADTTGTLAATLGIAGTSAPGSYSAATTQTALDAQFTLDGLSLVASSNTVTGVLAGVTLDLRGVETSADVTLKIVPDTAKGKAQIEDFIAKYNDVVDHLRAKLATSDVSSNRGILAGQTSFVTLLGDLRSAAIRGVGGLSSGVLTRLAEVGITSDRSGRLSLSDAGKLETALSGKPAQVEDLFGAADGAATRLYGILSSFTGTNGALDQERTLLNSQSKTLTDQIARIDAQLATREKTLRAQYSRLLELISQLTYQQDLFGSGS